MTLNDKKAFDFNENFINNYHEDSDKRYILKVDIDNQKYLHNLHSDLPFLSKRMKINKCNKFLCNLYDKELCSSYTSLKTNI